MNKMFIFTAAVAAVLATPAAAKQDKPGIKAKFGSATHIHVGRTSVSNGSALAVQFSGRTIAVGGASENAIDLGNIKINNNAAAGVEMPHRLLQAK